MRIKCKSCGIRKVRNYEKDRAGKRKVYTAEDGRYWNGLNCPDCHNKRRMENYQQHRSALPPVRKGYTYVKRGTKLRNCQSCQTKTPNYYHCSACYTAMQSSGNAALAEAQFFDRHGAL